MINRTFIHSALTAAIIVFSGNTFAEDQQPVRGGELMSQQEMQQLHEKMQNAKTAEERQQIQQENHELMRQRAEARGLKLRERPAGNQPPVRGGELMSQQERQQLREKMQNAKTAEERRQIQQENHELMRQRAEARGLKLRERPAGNQPPVRGGELMSQQERQQLREKMQNAKTAEERRQIQQETYEMMRQRAEARGLKLRERPAGNQPPVRGGELMSQQERQQLREKMQNAKTAEERRQIQQETYEMMRQRAEARGLKLRERPAGNQPPVRGGELMSQQEMQQLHEKMQNAKTAEERRQIQQENHEMMRQRAEARGLKLRERPAGNQPPVRGGELMSQQEMQQLHEKMQNAKTAEERQQIQQENHELMRSRAEQARDENMRERPAGNQPPVRGGELMSQQEMQQLHEKMQNAKTAEERQQIQQENHQLMRSRAEQARDENMRESPAGNQQPVRDVELMPQQEMQQLHEKMQNAKTAEERQQIQQENHELMRSRAEQARDENMRESPAGNQQPVRDVELMPQQEMQQLHEKMQNAKTAEERQQIQQENHELMRSRAEQARDENMRESPAGNQQPVRDVELMPQQEMQQLHEKMQNAKTAEERQQIQQENHELMRSRAEQARDENMHEISKEQKTVK